jgi:hypothetical protein
LKKTGMLAKFILSSHGRLYSNLPALERSEYFPCDPAGFERLLGPDYSWSLSPDYRSSNLLFAATDPAGQGAPIHIHDEFDLAPPAARTRRLELLYTMPVGDRLRDLNELRDETVGGYNYGGDGLPVVLRKRTPIPRLPIANRLPRDRAELEKFLTWQKQIEGVSELDDAWGRPFTFTLSGNMLVCDSPRVTSQLTTLGHNDISIAVPVNLESFRQPPGQSSPAKTPQPRSPSVAVP